MEGTQVSTYRYVLNRGFALASAEYALWVMLNPSTADETTDDPTIRRVRAFTARQGLERLVVVNLFALRATDPKVLTGSASDVGEDNDRTIKLEAQCASLIICAWGAHPVAVPRASVVLELLEPRRGGLWCLGKTKSGAPRHPLYVKGDQPLVKFP